MNALILHEAQQQQQQLWLLTLPPAAIFVRLYVCMHMPPLARRVFSFNFVIVIVTVNLPAPLLTRHFTVAKFNSAGNLLL